MKKSSLVEGKIKKEPENETRIQGKRKVSLKEWNHFTLGSLKGMEMELVLEKIQVK